MIESEAYFSGKYNVTLTLKNGEKRHFKQVEIDNEQWKLRNVRIILPNGEALLYPKSDIKRVEYNSKHE